MHVGSNCVLVAPVTLGAGGTVGADSTVTKNTPAGVLTVARGETNQPGREQMATPAENAKP